MKLLYFDDFRLGVLKGDTVVDVSKTVKGIPHTGPHDLINGLIERFADYRGKLEKAAASGRGIPVKRDRKSTRLNSSHLGISYAVFCLKKKKEIRRHMAELPHVVGERSAVQDAKEA